MYKNKGYIGNSRSVRSYAAIEDFEVPLCMFKKDLFNEFLSSYNSWNETNDYVLDDIEVIDDIYPDDIEFLKHISVAEWKYIANICGASSWHHTGKYFAKTDHYNLLQLSIEILKRKGTFKEEYKEYLKNKSSEQQNNFSFGVIKVQCWGGTKRYPQMLGYDTKAGIVDGNWLYYLDGNTISKLKVNSNKVEFFKTYNSYEELIEEHKEFSGTKRKFNKIVKERLNKK